MDTVVIGGGIAGISIAYELAADRDVTLVEAEKALATHTTGRSAATWIGSYGPPVVRQFTAESFAWFENPPIDVDHDIMTPHPCLWLACTEGDLEPLHELATATGSRPLDASEYLAINPYLRPEAVLEAAIDETAQDLDVAGLHQAYVRAFRSRGGSVLKDARVVSAKHGSNGWTLHLANRASLTAGTVVVAAGAWGDQLGAMFGAAPLGLTPKARTIFISGTAHPVSEMPFTVCVDESFYVKPEGSGVLASPADATLHDPGDPRPNNVEIARAMERINEVTTLGLRSVSASWAGLRTFALSGEPVVGWDDHVDGLFWFVGQGGFGIQMCPALAQHGASVLRSGAK